MHKSIYLPFYPRTLPLSAFFSWHLTHPVGVLCFRKVFKNIFICHLRNVFIRRKSSSLWQEWLFQHIKSEIISPTPILTVPPTWLLLFHHPSLVPPLSCSLSLILAFKAFLHSRSYSSQHSFLIHSKELSDLAEGISWKVAESEFEPSSSDKYSHLITGKEFTGFLLADPLLIREHIFESIIISTTCQA